MNYDKLARDVYAWNVSVGWWDDPDRCLYQTCQLVSTEVSEATEGERKDLMDDHLPERKMGEVELADALIRALDVGGRLDLSVMDSVSAHRWCVDPKATIGKQHFGITASDVRLGESLELSGGWVKSTIVEKAYTQLVKSIEYVAARNGYDLEAATREKMAYNKTRIDHTREHRETHFDGKKF